MTFVSAVRRRCPRRPFRRRGQAALEYILAFAGLLAVAAIMWGVVGASEKQSERAVRIVTSEYP
jgi:uncharacterized protein (UPF0333 family)